MHPWFDGQASGKQQGETDSQCAARTHTVFPLVPRRLGSEGQISPPQCSLSAVPRWALWLWQWVRLYPLWNAFTNTLCAGATGIKHRQPNSFHTSTFQITAGRITRNRSKFLALEVPMIPAGMQKRPSFFPPENNVLPRHCPNVSNEANERFVLTNLWKDSPHPPPG